MQLDPFKLGIRRNNDNLSPLIKLLQTFHQWYIYPDKVLFPILQHLRPDFNDPYRFKIPCLPGLNRVPAGTDQRELVAALGIRETLLRQLVHLPRELKEHALDCLTRQGVTGLQSQHVVGVRL